MEKRSDAYIGYDSSVRMLSNNICLSIDNKMTLDESDQEFAKIFVNQSIQQRSCNTRNG